MPDGYQLVDVVTDASGIRVHIGVEDIGDVIISGVGIRTLRFSADGRDRFTEAVARATTPGRPAREVDEDEVMKLVRKNFFTGSPDATEDDWRRYCDLIGPGVAEKYAGVPDGN